MDPADDNASSSDRALSLIAFGFTLTFFSGFGQTFFIGLYKGEILGDFPSLSHTSYGTLYSVATLASASCLGVVGRRIDVMSLRAYSLLVAAGLTAACLAMGSVSTLPGLVVTIFGLRLFGQGLMSHVSNTTTARYLDRRRGTALAIVNLGHPAGEALFPGLVATGAALLSSPDWWNGMLASISNLHFDTVHPVTSLLASRSGSRGLWFLAAIAVVVVVGPSIVTCLRGHEARHARLLASLKDRSGEAPGEKQWTPREIMKDRGFWMLMPGILTPPFVVTGYLFHQDVLRGDFGWSTEMFAASFVGFGVAQVATSPIAGLLVDRLGAQRVLPYFLVPLATGSGLATIGDPSWSAHALMVGAGLTGGSGYAIVGAMWAERYGVLHLGAIRSLATVLMVTSTAASPPLFGVLVDSGVSMVEIASGVVLGVVVASLGLFAGSRRHDRANAQTDDPGDRGTTA